MNTWAEQFELSQLPVLPQLLTKLIQELNDESVQLSKLAEIIEQDAALSLKVLAVANSSYYSRRKSLTSIFNCANLLGSRTIKMIAISVSMHQFLGSLSGISQESLGKFWQHSMVIAYLSRGIAQLTGYPSPEEAYLAGLLHDIGQLVLFTNNSTGYQEMFHKSATRGEQLELETALFGITHAEIGAMLTERWHLGILISDAIRHHHDEISQVINASELVKIVMLANMLSKMSAENSHPTLAVARVLFDISADVAQGLRADAQAAMITLAVSLGIKSVDDVPIEKSKPAARGFTFSTEQQSLLASTRGSAMLSLTSESYTLAFDELDLLGQIVMAAELLFEPVETFLFEWDINTNLISGYPLGDQHESIARMRIPLDPNKSLMASALLGNTPMHSIIQPSGKARNLVDEQVISMSGADAIYCLPMRTPTFMYGVLVLAFNTGALSRLNLHSSFMAAFAKQAATFIEDERKRLPIAAISAIPNQDEYQLNVRKIVHEASNPLAIVKNYLKVLDFKLSDHQPITQELEILNGEIDRVTAIIRQFSNPESSELANGQVDVNALIRSVVSVCDRALFLPAGIVVEFHLDNSIAPIESDMDRVKQVFLNLFKNAAEAMTRGGKLILTSSKMINQQGDECVMFRVADTGPGIPQDMFARLFSPVKSTKGSENSGLGLSITAGILKELGGSISCSTTTGRGTFFDIILPNRNIQHV